MFPEPREHPQHRRPLWLAALATTLVAPLPYVAYEGLQALATQGSLAGDGHAVSPLFGITFAGLMVSAFSMYVVGLPLVLMLRKAGKLTLARLCLAATGAGMAGMLAVVLAFESTPQPVLFAFGAGFGALAGCVFGLVAGIRIKSP